MRLDLVWLRMTATCLVRVIVVSMLALLAVSWRLWVTIDRFPAVPWWSGATSWPVTIDRISAGCLAGSLIGAALVAASPQRTRVALFLALVSLMVLVVGNQHRLQPWAYHFAIMATFIVLLGPRDAVRSIRWVHASVYFYSAINKFDYQFLTATGPMFLRTLRQSIGLSWEPSDLGVAQGVWLFPVGELLVAVALMVPRTRRLGCAMATLLHGMLLIILGPTGLHQRWGVLTWNVVFLVQTWVYFNLSPRAMPDEANDAEVDSSTLRLVNWPAGWRWQQHVAWALGSIVLLAPLLEPWGRWDHWLSWGLYSARAPRAELFVADAVVSQLPPSVQPYCGPLERDGIWRHLALDRWSLEQLQVPIYPQDRFQVGVARAILNTMPASQRWVMVVRYGPPDRWTGRTAARTLTGEQALLDSQREYWGNTRPRDIRQFSARPLRDVARE